ncbi:unnamed protein product, partial [Hapterophycus canaliculatus]
IEFTECLRQHGPTETLFTGGLLTVAERRATREYYDLSKTRMRSQPSDSELARFLDAVLLFPTNDKADNQNRTHSAALGSPIALLKAHRVRGYANPSADRFRSPLPHHYLAVGECVFINKNVWTSAGYR